MLNTTNATKTINKLFIYIAVTAILLMSAQAIFLPGMANAAQLTSRSLELSTSAPNTSATWTFTFDAPATTALNGIAVQICTTASGACTAPGTGANWTNAGSAFGSLSYNGSGQAGWTLDNSAGFLRAKNNSSSQATSNPIVLTFNTVTNPDTTNTTFFGRITTYTGDDFTGALDTGVVAASTATQITITGTMDESLVFCSGTSITGENCGTISGSAVTLNDSSLSSTAARYGTSVFAVSTNGVSGYSVTINGSTLTCSACSGSPTIAAMGTQSANGAPATSSPGTAQFGLNLRANDGTPTVGANITGSGSGTQGTNYNTNNQYRFFTGDEVGTAAAATAANAFTVSYIINVPGSQPAGSYTSTMTYIATATF